MRMTLKPCPFCGKFLEQRTAYFLHPRSKCILSERSFQNGFIGQWNRRATEPTLSAEKEG